MHGVPQAQARSGRGFVRSFAVISEVHRRVQRSAPLPLAFASPLVLVTVVVLLARNLHANRGECAACGVRRTLRVGAFLLPVACCCFQISEGFSFSVSVAAASHRELAKIAILWAMGFL